MPKVPQLEQQVAPRALPGVREGPGGSPESYGAGVGDTLARVGASLYASELWNANQTAVMEADTLASQEQLRIQQDVSKMHGKDAATAPDYAASEWQKVDDLIMKGLANDHQRGQYQGLSRQKRETLNRGALQHSNQELERFSQDTYKANLQTSVDVARANADSPLAVAFEKDLQEQKIREHAIHYGYADTPQYHEEVRGLRSHTNREVINGLLAKGSDLQAKAYYDHLAAQEKAHPQSLQFTAADRDTIEKNIFEGSTRGASRRLTQELIGQHGLETPEQRKDILAAIDQITDDKVADATKQRIEHEFSVYDQIKTQEHSQTFLNASKLVTEQGQKQPRATLQDLLPPDLYTSMGPNEQTTLQHQLDRERKPESVAHDAGAWFDFRSMPDATLARMRPEQVMEWVNKFDATHRDRAIEDWHAAKNHEEKGDKDPKYLSVLSHKERIMNAWKESAIVDNSIPRSKWTKEDETNFSRFEDAADKALSALPKDAKPEEIKKVLDQLTDTQLKQKFTVDPGLFSRNKQVPAIGMGDIKDARSIRIPKAEIPEGEQEIIKGLLRSGNKPLSTDKIERIYALKRLQQTGQMDGDAAKQAMRAIVLE